jgi:ribonuclease J
MLKLMRPRHFIPVHGEYRHLVQHAQLARSMGVPEAGVAVLENGDVFRISGKVGGVFGRAPSGRIYVDGQGVGDVGNIVLTDRRILSEGGTITCALAHRDGVVVSGPYFKSKGLVYEPDYKDLLEEARRVVLETLEGLRAEGRANLDDTKDEIARAVRRLFNKRIGRRPIVIPVIMEV